ncbi:MAG: hypothetical protein Q6370_013570 [Candidatus Sigynarchaeota archaeon]
MMPRAIPQAGHSLIDDLDPEHPGLIAAILRTNPVAREIYCNNDVQASTRRKKET